MDREYIAHVLMHSLMLMMTTYCCIAMKPTNIATDESALVALKAHITSDPLQILSQNWSSSSSAASISSSSSSVCDWVGVRCGSRHRRVAALNISGMGLTGTVPPHLGNLSFLVSLDLGRNYFYGTLPRELSRLRRIRFVSLGSNNFSGPVPTWFGPKLQILALNENDFSGVIPSSISNLSKLETLNFEGNLLTGNIPEEIGNLRSLRLLNLQQNRLVGSIPSAIFNISTLEIVSLTYNNLTGSLPDDICHHLSSLKGLHLSANQLSGQIPSSLSRCSHLQILSLSFNNFRGFIPKELGNMEMLEGLALGGNNLQGVIPREIGNLRNLERFAIERNRISGSIPKEIGNLTKLTLLNLGVNFLTGAIPEEVGNLQKLEELYATLNYLNGSIPIGIFNLSTLSVVSFGVNQITGNLPSNIGYQLPKLEVFGLDVNNISGVIPASIVNCSKLNILLFEANQFTGSIPKSLGNLELLEELNLSENHLTGDPTSSELDFLTSLTKCKSLNSLVLSGNPLNGMLPNSIGNLSTSLLHFLAERTKLIRGPIPSEIGNLSSLIIISLQDNQLTEPIPRSVMYLQNLQGLYLRQNKLKGTLDTFCSMHRLANLYLSQNQVSGPIPECFRNMTSLRSLHLEYNLLTSSIPSSLWKLSDLGELVLASNSFNGSLPPEIGNLKAAISMDLSMNQISGAIPSSLGDLQNLQYLSLANNQLQESIPESMGNMLSLTSLNLAHNNLSGLIPKSLEALQYLKVFDVSNNHLRGEIPSGGPFKNFTSESFSSNDALCGDPKFQVPQCQTNKKHKLTVKRVLLFTLIPLVIAILVVILAFASYIFWRQRRKSMVPSATNVSVIPAKERISYYELLQATGGYDESNLLGAGSFGSVYKAVLRDARSVAVKVFNLRFSEAFRSFDVECEVFRNLRHRNLVKVLSSCSNHDFKALVLQYMSNGSLEKWLYSSHNQLLNIMQRLNIMIDVASALHYLHHEYTSPVIHCDLKPSNVLLDEDMVAHVSDFGIAKMLGKEESMALTKTFATIGYIAPEYGSEGLISRRCDVYSYGIMLMEVFTRKRPNDEMFAGNLNLKSWVNDSMRADSIIGVVDANLLNPTEEHFDKKKNGVFVINHGVGTELCL